MKKHQGTGVLTNNQQRPTTAAQDRGPGAEAIEGEATRGGDVAGEADPEVGDGHHEEVDILEVGPGPGAEIIIVAEAEGHHVAEPDPTPRQNYFGLRQRRSRMNTKLEEI